MNNELISRARELAQAATPGPWGFYDAYDIIDRPGVVGARRLGTKEDTIIEASRYGYDELNVSETDAAFIAASRELVPALCDEVARVTDERDAWFSWAVKLGKKVGCLASTFPDSNSHISDAIDRLISSRDLERMAIKEYLNEIDGVRQVYRRIDLSNSEIEEAMFQENAAIETLRRAASGGEMNTNDEYKVQSPDALEVERLREELARWASGETFSQHAAEIYENLRGEVAQLRQDSGMKEDALASYAEFYAAMGTALGIDTELPSSSCDNAMLEKAARLKAENARLREALASLRVKEHYDCEDGWYSCPKVPDYYGSGDENTCTCGMDRINAVIDAALEPRP